MFEHHGPPGPKMAGRRGGKGATPGTEEVHGLRGRVRSVFSQVRGTMVGIPRVMQLVWGASQALTLVLAISTILAGFVPAIQAYIAKLLVNAVVQARFIHRSHAPDRIALHTPLLWGAVGLPVLSALGVVVALALMQFAITAVSALLQTLTNISQQ